MGMVNDDNADGSALEFEAQFWVVAGQAVPKTHFGFGVGQTGFSLSTPTDANTQCKLADAWWDLSDTIEGVAKTRMQQRAAYWYDLALSDLAVADSARAGSARAVQANQSA